MWLGSPASFLKWMACQSITLPLIVQHTTNTCLGHQHSLSAEATQHIWRFWPSPSKIPLEPCFLVLLMPLDVSLPRVMVLDSLWYIPVSSACWESQNPRLDLSIRAAAILRTKHETAVPSSKISKMVIAQISQGIQSTGRWIIQNRNKWSAPLGMRSYRPFILCRSLYLSFTGTEPNR